ncbi:MAG: hypothetical protein Q8P51_00735 [Ignavibacteria bacterium]|nr:hypothetical protein [Ignavibacteria bacterium]
MTHVLRYNIRGTRTSDELRDTWDNSGAIQQAEFAMRLARPLADQSAVPVWNKRDEFEAAGFKVRKRM